MNNKLTDLEIAMKLEEIEREESKRLTIEETAEKLFPYTKDDVENRIITIKRLYWIDGAKWQAERGFDEEEVCEFVEWMNLHYRDLEHTLSFKDARGTKELLKKWFDEFKNK
jgi:hypothetical protein